MLVNSRLTTAATTGWGSEMKILLEKTPHYYYRWYAVDDDTYDGPGSPMGFGRTEQEAIEDLLAEIEDRAREACERANA